MEALTKRHHGRRVFRERRSCFTPPCRSKRRPASGDTPSEDQATWMSCASADGPNTRRAARAHLAGRYRSLSASHERPERPPNRLIEQAYTEGERLGLAVCGYGEADPYQAIPRPGIRWHNMPGEAGPGVGRLVGRASRCGSAYVGLVRGSPNLDLARGLEYSVLGIVIMSSPLRYSAATLAGPVDRRAQSQRASEPGRAELLPHGSGALRLRPAVPTFPGLTPCPRGRRP